MSPKNYFGSTHKNHRHSTSTHILHEHFRKLLKTAQVVSMWGICQFPSWLCVCRANMGHEGILLLPHF